MAKTIKQNKIALVEDQQVMREAMSSYLSKFGYETIFQADNGRHMQEFLHKHFIPDLILLDIVMPEMDGFVFYENAFSTHGSGYWFGVCLAIIAMLSWSFATIIIARQSIKVNAYYGMGWQMLFSSFLIFLGSLALGKNIPLSSISMDAWLVVGYLILAGSIVAVVAFIYSMRHLPASVAALYAYINPIIAVITGSILLKEHISLNIIIGTVITLAGVYLVNRFTKKKTVQKEAELPDTELV